MRIPPPMNTAAFAAALLLAWSVPAAQASWPPAGLALCTESHDQGALAIVTDGGRGAIVVWADSRFGNTDLFAQKVDSSGVVRWTANGVAVCTEPHSQSYMRAVPYSGGAIVYWSDSRSGSLDVFGQRLSDQGVPLWTFDGVAIASGPGEQTLLDVIPDYASPSFTTPGQIVLWRNRPSSDLEGNLNLQRVVNGGALAWPGGTSGVPLLGTTSERYFAVMTSDGTPSSALGPRGAVVAWVDGGAAAQTGLFARRISNTGAPQWSSAGTMVCAPLASLGPPAIEAVGSGNTVVAWSDSRDVSTNLFAQKLSVAGVPQWLTNGVPVCRAEGTQNLLAMVADAAGGVILVWQDSRGATQQIYAQRLDGNGQPVWAVDGIPVCATASTQSAPELVSDGAGGAIVVWSDSRANDGCFAQRIDPNGNHLWLAGGVRLATGAAPLSSPAVVSDNAFGVIGAWTDQRAASRDIYALRLTSGAALVDVEELPGTEDSRAAAALSLAPPAPNPARADFVLRYALPRAARVSLALHDVAGRLVHTLASGERAAGTHALRVPLADEAGRRLAPGVYLVRLECEGRSLSRRLVVLN